MLLIKKNIYQKHYDENINNFTNDFIKTILNIKEYYDMESIIDDYFGKQKIIEPNLFFKSLKLLINKYNITDNFVKNRIILQAFKMLFSINDKYLEHIRKKININHNSRQRLFESLLHRSCNYTIMFCNISEI